MLGAVGVYLRHRSRLRFRLAFGGSFVVIVNGRRGQVFVLVAGALFADVTVPTLPVLGLIDVQVHRCQVGTISVTVFVLLDPPFLWSQFQFARRCVLGFFDSLVAGLAGSHLAFFVVFVFFGEEHGGKF